MSESNNNSCDSNVHGKRQFIFLKNCSSVFKLKHNFPKIDLNILHERMFFFSPKWDFLVI